MVEQAISKVEVLALLRVTSRNLVSLRTILRIS